MSVDQSELLDRFSEFVQRWDGLSLNEASLRDAELGIYADQQVSIYYLPEFAFNKKARVYLLGITPGWTQLTKFYRMCREREDAILPEGKLSTEARLHGAFAGTMRNNLVEMLDNIGLNQVLRIDCCDALFGSCEEMLMTGSILHYPVFTNGKNYTGHGPAVLKHEVLKELAVASLRRRLSLFEGDLIVPLGVATGQVLRYLIAQGDLEEARCLFGFPHPSGANGHRHAQFQEHKSRMSAQVKRLFA